MSQDQRIALLDVYHNLVESRNINKLLSCIADSRKEIWSKNSILQNFIDTETKKTETDFEQLETVLTKKMRQRVSESVSRFG